MACFLCGKPLIPGDPSFEFETETICSGCDETVNRFAESFTSKAGAEMEKDAGALASIVKTEQARKKVCEHLVKGEQTNAKRRSLDDAGMLEEGKGILGGAAVVLAITGAYFPFGIALAIEIAVLILGIIAIRGKKGRHNITRGWIAIILSALVIIIRSDIALHALGY